MGEIAEMILEGILCEGCGEVLEDILEGEDGPGFPRLCSVCAAASQRPFGSLQERKPIQCSVKGCFKRFKSEYARNCHLRDKHGHQEARDGK